MLKKYSKNATYLVVCHLGNYRPPVSYTLEISSQADVKSKLISNAATYRFRNIRNSDRPKLPENSVFLPRWWSVWGGIPPTKKRKRHVRNVALPSCKISPPPTYLPPDKNTPECVSNTHIRQTRRRGQLQLCVTPRPLSRGNSKLTAASNAGDV